MTFSQDLGHRFICIIRGAAPAPRDGIYSAGGARRSARRAPWRVSSRRSRGCDAPSRRAPALVKLTSSLNYANKAAVICICTARGACLRENMRGGKRGRRGLYGEGEGSGWNSEPRKVRGSKRRQAQALARARRGASGPRDLARSPVEHAGAFFTALGSAGPHAQIVGPGARRATASHSTGRLTPPAVGMRFRRTNRT
ncbi:hypothetical protein SKAU_G00338070 [Synaphobranchus kaupii]|uniref:Uncharacterized protein n=1 Tax=Synaphobranchus kaupii TaxID=118154 RepID=A0A9Q1EMF1_SYNKA|nr:hypothetical protein SKAU_G00338070 [Synaphobranchus kaupii]